MTKEEYLIMRNDPMLLLFRYYIEKCTKNCLDMGVFQQQIAMYPKIHEAYTNVIKEWDSKFEVTILSKLDTGEILKVY